MASETDIKSASKASGAEAASPSPALSDGDAAASALLVRSDRREDVVGELDSDPRLNRLPMQLDVLVKVRSMRVQDLLALERGTVVETVHEHSQDVPVHCGGALLMWAEFEVADQNLAVRITRLA